jgi:subtilisin family serine protease
VGAASAVVGAGALVLPGTGPAQARPPEPGPAPSIPLEDPVSVAPPPGDGATPAPDTSRIAEDGIRPLQYWLDEYGVREAWAESTGEGVRIAVIDTGVDGSHQDLEGAVVAGTDVSGGGSADGQEGLGTEPDRKSVV